MQTRADIQRALRAAELTLSAARDAVFAADYVSSPEFLQAAVALTECTGSVITTGIGKSWLAAQKMAVTLASVGIAAYGVNASEAAHGHAGGARPGDVGVAFTASGETPETCACARLLRARGSKLIGLCCREGPTAISKVCDVTVVLPYDARWDLLESVPTTTTTSLMVAADALIGAVVSLRLISAADYFERHPGSGHW